jgi:hypothetical protein
VNALLQQQLGMSQLLQPSVDKAGQPLMWHVWWHIGIRRYHWVQQQQRRQQQLDRGDVEERQPAPQSANEVKAAASKSSKARTKQRARKQQAQEAAQQSGLQPLSAAQLTALYDDPAARYYAAGFAARQTAAYGTGLRARAVLRTPHMMLCREVSQTLRDGRTFALVQNMKWSTEDELAPDLEVLEQLVTEASKVHVVCVGAVHLLPLAAIHSQPWTKLCVHKDTCWLDVCALFRAPASTAIACRVQLACCVE